MPKQEDILQRSVLYWIQDEEEDKQELHDAEEEEDDEPGDAPPPKRHTTIETEEVVLKYGVPQKLFVNYVSREIQSTESCQSLPFTLLLVISYALLAINHDDAPKVNAVEDSISFDIQENANFAFNGDFMGHKNIMDVNTHADFWSWLSRGFMPLIWQQAYAVSENRDTNEPYVQQVAKVYNRRDRGVLLNYNRIILGVRLSQERDLDAIQASKSDVPQCKFQNLQNLYDKNCVGGRGYELEPETFEARKTTNPTRVHWLYIHDDIEYIRRQLVQMEQMGWLDEHTKKIELAFPVYNAEYGLHTMFICCFFFSRGGHIWKDIIPLSAFAQNWNSFRSVVYDLIWVFCVAWVLVTEGLELWGIIKEHGTAGIVNEYLGLWNCVDWISVAAAMGIIFMFFLNFNNVGAMNNALRDLGEINEEKARSEYRNQGKDYVMKLEAELQFAYIFRCFQALYPLVIALRLFKAFGSQPRLAVVTKTLTNAWIDLVHFLLIFMSVFCTYTVAGVVLFGREVSSFTTAFRAMITCFRIVFGDFDWEDMRTVGRLDAFFWFVPFVILIMMVLMNMLIAIVMDAYDEVVTDLDHEDDIVKMIKKSFGLKKKKKDYLSVNEILKCFQQKIHREQLLKAEEEEDGDEDLADEIEDDEGPKTKGKMGKKKRNMAATILKNRTQEDNVTVTMMKDLFPEKMHSAQAKELIRDSIMYYYTSHKEVGDINEVLTAIGRIDYRTKRLKLKTQERVKAEGLSVNHPVDVHRISENCYAETDALREDLSQWLPEDPDDVSLPAHWMHPRVTNADADLELEEVNEANNNRQPPGLSKAIKHFSGRETGAGHKIAPDLHEGNTLQLINDEQLILKACREAGIAPTYDHLRKQAVGKTVKVVARDDDGTVLCRLPGVGEVWFAATAFVPTLRQKEEERAVEEGSTMTGVSDRSDEAAQRRVQDLEEDVRHGKEVVEECLQALKTLHDDLMQLKSEKRKGIEKFQKYRHEAVATQRANVHEKERFKDLQDKVKEVTAERDGYFEETKKLVKENHDLEVEIAAREAQVANERNGRRR